LGGGRNDLSEKPRHGVESRNPAPHPGIDERNSTLAIGFRASLALHAVRQSERARYYSENDARFLTPDPSGLYYANPLDPQSLNLYDYVENNPLVNIDPSGLDCFTTSNLTSTSVTVTTYVGATSCNGIKGGTYVNGTINTSSYGAAVGSDGQVHLSFSYAPAGEGSGSIGADGVYTMQGPGWGSKDIGAWPGSSIPSSSSGDALNPFATAVFHQVAQDTAGFPDVCSGGAFVYAGGQFKAGPAHGFAGYLGNYDSKDGWSNNALFEGSKGNASGGVAAGRKGAEGLVFIPFAEAGGALIGASKSGLSVGGYGGTPESMPLGAGAGAYFTISSMGGCAHR
jgi:RHS repeat-associated protein